MNKKSGTLICIIWTVLLAGCTNPADQSPSPTSFIAAPSAGMQVRRSSTSTATQFSTQSMTSTITPELENSSTILIPSLTPLPTLSSVESEALVNELLLHNADCRFPCWWGIVPGKTTWPEARHFLESFVEITPFVAKNCTACEPTYLIGYPLPNEQGGGGFNIYVEGSRITLMYIGRDSTEPNSLLHQVLTNYGSPEKIYIRVIKDAPSDNLPLTLVLYYSSDHFTVSYKMIAHENNEELVSCTNSESPGLWLWADGEIVTEQRLQDWTLGVDPILPLKPLEQVTDLDVNSFTELFSKPPSENTCLRTNKDFWEIKR